MDGGHFVSGEKAELDSLVPASLISSNSLPLFYGSKPFQLKLWRNPPIPITHEDADTWRSAPEGIRTTALPGGLADRRGSNADRIYRDVKMDIGQEWVDICRPKFYSSYRVP